MAPLDDERREIKDPRHQNRRLRIKRIAGTRAGRDERASSNSARTFQDPNFDRYSHRVRDDEDDEDGGNDTAMTKANSFNGSQNNYDNEDDIGYEDPHGHPPPLQTSQSSTAPAISSKLSMALLSSTKSVPVMVPTFVATATSPSAVTTNPPLAALTSSQYQKGLDTNNYDNYYTSSSISTTSTAATPTALAEASGTTTMRQSGYHHNKHEGLSPSAQHLLIAAGAIGAFIIIVTGVYLIFRLRKLTMLRNRQSGKGGRKGWYGWRRMDEVPTLDMPPKYTGLDDYCGVSAGEKSIPAQRQLNAFFSPVVAPQLATTNAELSRADSGRQKLVREALLGNPGPFGYNAASQQSEIRATEASYGYRTPSEAEYPRVQLLRQASDAQGNTLNTQSSTQNVLLAHSPSNGEEREAKYMSYLSSLSSGFGDGLVIPEESIAPQPNANANARGSRRQSRSSYMNRISWSTSLPGTRASRGDRDTIYTTASVESAPRFRSINSWVAQQSSQLGRTRQSDREIPQMPIIPPPLRAASTQRREPAENPAFQFHPGDKLIISRGSRVPSEILDKKFPRR